MLAGTQKPMLGTKRNKAHPLARGLVGCWLFNEGVGNKAYDLSGYDNHGTLTDMAAPSTTTSGWNPGNDGVGLMFDGTNDYVNCGKNSSLDITDAITIEAWVNSKNIGLPQAIYSKKKNLGTTFLLDINRINAGYFEFSNFGGSWQTAKTSTSGYSSNTWIYLAGVYNGTHLVIYVNGIEKDSVVATIDNTLPHNSYIGSYISTSDFFNGAIDGVKIYNRVLSADEIKWSYRAPYAMFERGELLL